MNANPKLLTSSFVFPNRPESFWKRSKLFIFNYFPIVLGGIVTILVLFGFQILAIAITDRIGISPKNSILISSLVYVIGLIGIAGFSSLKNSGAKTISFQMKKVEKTNEPICKILMIKKRGV